MHCLSCGMESCRIQNPGSLRTGNFLSDPESFFWSSFLRDSMRNFSKSAPRPSSLRPALAGRSRNSASASDTFGHAQDSSSTFSILPNVAMIAGNAVNQPTPMSKNSKRTSRTSSSSSSSEISSELVAGSGTAYRKPPSTCRVVFG